MAGEQAQAHDDDVLAQQVTRLYRLPAAEFTAARKEGAAAAHSAGRTGLAQRIGTLAKPSAAAWLVNMLVIHRPQEVDGLLRVGEKLRQAQAELDQAKMRSLSRERRGLLAKLLKSGRELAADLGSKASDAVLRDVEQTLRAATTDAWAAAAVRTGTLTRAISADGWGTVDLSGAVAAQVRQAGKTASGEIADESADGESAGPRLTARMREAAQRKTEAADRAAAEAERTAEGLRQQNRELTATRTALRTRLGELTDLADEAKRNIAAADREVERLQRQQEHAARAAATARNAAERAAERLREH
ncbi:hypothetical protein IV500_17720 [Paeniglutamicibacter antarcticus]|uniref:Uncharacterized protein n=1 Tax=Arthrobacter terrae TaxID=2935737 RepID=A0A931G6M6_9MICC|nr:hypothetical protein [Arthrobacter terrae]MBG0741208.1 hypothetical protein [Arthrobacter terrae]